MKTKRTVTVKKQFRLAAVSGSLQNLKYMNAIYDLSNIKNDGKHDFETPTAYAGCLNMSAGIFQLEIKSGGKGLKRKKVVVRVIGTKYQRKEIETKTKEICALLDNGAYSGKKSVRI